MISLPDPDECGVEEHILLSVFVNEMLLKVDPVGAFDSTGSYSEYIPEVPYLVDMIANNRITREGIKDIFDYFFFPGYATEDNIDALHLAALKVRELWLHNVESSHRVEIQRDAVCTVFAQAWIKRCASRTFCKCDRCSDFVELTGHLGLSFQSPFSKDTSDVMFADNHEKWTGVAYPNASVRRDVIAFLNTLHHFQCLKKSNILEGWSEVPEIVGNLLHQEGWRQRLRDIEDLRQGHFMRTFTIQEFIKSLALAAFTEEYLGAAFDPS